MTGKDINRQTIMCPDEMMDLVNAALGLSLELAGRSGGAYAAGSLVPSAAIGAADLPPKFGSKLRFRAGCDWASLDTSMG